MGRDSRSTYKEEKLQNIMYSTVPFKKKKFRKIPERDALFYDFT